MKTYEEIEDEFIEQADRSLKSIDPMKLAKAFGDYFVSVDELLKRSDGGIREIAAPFKAATLQKIAEVLMETLDDEGKDVVKSNKGILDHIITTVTLRGKVRHDE